VLIIDTEAFPTALFLFPKVFLDHSLHIQIYVGFTVSSLATNTQGPMNIEGVAEKPVAAASESLDERLVHGPGRGIVEKYRGAKAIEEPDLQMIII
jgi:hypothetical protein